MVSAARCLSADRWYQLLAGLLVGRAPASPVPDEAEWVELVALAEAEGVGPLLHGALAALPAVRVPTVCREALEKSYQDAVCASLLHEHTRARLCRRFEERSIPVLLLKGAALALTHYQDPATRPMADLDVLVPRSRLDEAARCLEEDGLRHHPLPRSLLSPLNRPHVHFVYRHAGTGAVVELHWQIGVLRRTPIEVMAEIWAHAQPVGNGTEARRMCLAHTVPLLSAHMTLQHKRADMLWLFDLHRVLLTMDTEAAAQVQETATRWRMVPCTAHALLRARALFDTSIPRPLAAWASEAALQDNLQARVARLALAPGAAEMPHGGLVNLAMNGDWRLLRSLLPAPGVVRERLGLTPRERVTFAYLALMARRLRKGPAQLRQFWRLWRGASLPSARGEGTSAGREGIGSAKARR